MMTAYAPVPSADGQCFEFDARAAAVDSVHAQTAIYTSSHVVEALLDRVNWPLGEHRFLDPSCGDGAFILAALERLRLMPDDVDTALRVRGCEIHPGAVSDCRERVRAFLLERGWRPEVAERTAVEMIVECDFLTDGPDLGQFDVVGGNPPYLRYAHLPDFFKAIYALTVEEYARGDLLHMFLARCCASLPEDGAIALVTSDRWIGNSTAAPLRGRLGKLVGVDHIERLDCSTSFYRPKRRVKGSPPRVHPIAVVLRPKGLAKFELSEAAISPDGADEKPYTGRTLADIANVRLAPWLGPIGAFVLNEREANLLRSHAELVPAVDTDDIARDSDVLKKPCRWAIRTTACREPSGRLQQHLQQWAPKMPKRSETRPYWLPPETITLPLSEPALLIPRISRTLRVIDLPAGILPINHNLSVVAKSESHTLEEIKAILLSEKSQQWIARNAQGIDNGYKSIITTLLRRLPID